MVRLRKRPELTMLVISTFFNSICSEALTLLSETRQATVLLSFITALTRGGRSRRYNHRKVVLCPIKFEFAPVLTMQRTVRGDALLSTTFKEYIFPSKQRTCNLFLYSYSTSYLD